MRSDSRARRSDRRSVCRDSAVRAADPNGNVSRMCVSDGSARGVLAGAAAARGGTSGDGSAAAAAATQWLHRSVAVAATGIDAGPGRVLGVSVGHAGSAHAAK